MATRSPRINPTGSWKSTRLSNGSGTTSVSAPRKYGSTRKKRATINKKIVAAGGVPLFRFTLPGGTGSGDDQPALLGGASIAKYWNKFTQQFLDIRIHPNLAPGSIFFNSSEIPYPLSGVDNVTFIRCRRDYYQIEWPVVSRQYVYGVYADEVLVCRAPFSLGVIANVANG
ncbi:MAG TPA: hypothetical protein VFB76_15485 [Candidatus Angelobacter sp.]|nr:hypothetical protein [Candidatus Angelobacter sp.]